MSTSRSAPCPCGSGLKYKRCHGSETPPGTDPSDAAWQRVRRAIDRNASELISFGQKLHGQPGLAEAWEEFTSAEPEIPFGEDSFVFQLFMSWYQCIWTPDPFSGMAANEATSGGTIVSLYLERHGASLDPVLREYLESVDGGPLSMWEVLDVDADRGFRLRDFFTRDEHFVFERSASRTANRGDVFLGFLGHANGVWLVEGLAGLPLGGAARLEVIRFRERILRGRQSLTRDEIAEYEYDLLDFYMPVAARLMNPRMPKLSNTDGDEVELHTVVYDIESPQRAFEALKHLDLANGAAAADHSVRRDAGGRVVGAEINWSLAQGGGGVRGGGVSLGQIQIDGTRLTANVNSADRARRVRRLIEGALGAGAVWRVTETVDLEQELAARRLKPTQSAGPDAESQLLMQNPEVRAHLEAMLAAHYERWIDDPLPALDGKSPRQAVRDRVGREMVETLIADLEAMGKRSSGVHAGPAVVAKLRRDLGLSDTEPG